MVLHSVGTPTLYTVHNPKPYYHSTNKATYSLFHGRHIVLTADSKTYSLSVRAKGEVRSPFFIAVFTLDDGLLARSQYSEGPATGHLDTGFSRFPCVYKQTLRRFPTFQVATTCFSCSPPDLNLVVTNLMFCLHVK